MITGATKAVWAFVAGKKTQRRASRGPGLKAPYLARYSRA